MQKMSSISAQGVVERASAELSKRINGLGLRSKHHHSSSSGGGSSSGSTSGTGKTSVMERVTNALCGGGSHSNTASIGGAPEKPSRVGQTSAASASGATAAAGVIAHGSGCAATVPSGTSTSAGKTNQTADNNIGTASNQQSTPQVNRKVPAQRLAQGGHHDSIAQQHLLSHPSPAAIITIDQLLLDDKFLAKFFQYFTSFERRQLAQVCTRWRDIMYRAPRYWSGLLPVLQCRELRLVANQDRVKLYNSLIRRGFHAVCLVSATDEDALDVVHSFPLASKHVHSLSLRCSSVSDRGLEALLDHLQVRFYQFAYLFLECNAFEITTLVSF